MNVGALIEDAWRTTWRAKWLWVFGLFAGGASGSCGGGSPNFSYGTSQPFSADASAPSTAEMERLLNQVMAAMAAYWALLVGAAVVLFLVGLALWVLSIVCRGAAIDGGAAVAENRPTGPGPVWRAGLASFWRLLGLHALLLLLGLLTLAAVAVAVLSLAVHPGQPIDWLALLGVIGVTGVVSFAVWTVLGVLVAYAERAIVLDRAGPLEGLAVGWHLARTHLGSTALVWVTGLGLSIGGAIALGLTMVVVGIPTGMLGLMGVLLARGDIAGPVGVALVALAVLVFLIGIGVATSVFNTYFWNYWTLAYLRLARPEEPQLES